ncbi:hypothetical protein BH23GEM9_BH23GEM9_28520 [soil metagenome]
MFEDQKPISKIALKIGIAGFIGFGAIATGMFVTRKGRHLVKEAWQGRERTRIEDRVLDLWWDDPRIARRKIDVREIEPGHIELSGIVHSVGERRRIVQLAKTVNGVNVIDDHLQVVNRDKDSTLLKAPHVFAAVRSRRKSKRDSGTLKDNRDVPLEHIDDADDPDDDTL